MTSEPDPISADTDPRVLAIQKAAFHAFQTYGFRRTSMEDIARGANMSRSALYLHFKNKEDIYRSLVRYYYAVNADAMAEALAAHDDPEAALAAGFAAKDGQIIEAILASPHGAELMDTGFGLSMDLARAGEARFAAVLAAWVSDRAARGQIVLPEDLGGADKLAETLLAAMKGLKQPGVTPDDYVTSREMLARLAARALKP